MKLLSNTLIALAAGYGMFHLSLEAYVAIRRDVGRCYLVGSKQHPHGDSPDQATAS